MPAVRPHRVLVWRLAVAASALTGVVLAARQHDVWWTALSQLSSLAVGVAYLGLAAYPHLTGRPEPRSPWLRGALATLMLLVSIAFLAMQHGNLLDPYSLFEHLLTPALVLTDVALVGVNQAAFRRWHPLSWAAVPLPYLGWYVVADLAVYADLDPSRSGEFVLRVAGLVLLLLLAGHLVALTGRSRRLPAPRGALLTSVQQVVQSGRWRPSRTRAT